MKKTNPIDTVLVLENDPDDFMLLQGNLKLLGLKIKAKDHFETLSGILKSHYPKPPDIIFLDLNVPDSSGLETFLSVSKVFPASPIIILTGMHDRSISLQAIQAGAQDYMVKGDFQVKLLEKTMQYSVERKRNQLKLEEAYSRYELVSKATNDAIWDWDLSTNEIVWNDKVAIFGYPPEVRKNAAWRAANVHPEDYYRFSSQLTRSHEGDYWQLAYRFRCLDGSYKHILDRGYIMRSIEGKQYRMIGSMTDITRQVNLQGELEVERIKRQKAILKATLDGQENERNEIGKELHDNINQMLATVRLCIATSLSDEAVRPTLLNKGMNVTDECIEEVRRLSARLVSPKHQNISLKDILDEFIFRLRLNQDMIFEEYFENEALEMLDGDQRISVYRILQEHTNNIMKHAKASAIKMSIVKKQEHIHVSIDDDGQGFDPSSMTGGIGTQNMKTRAMLINASLNLISSPGKGCRLELLIPDTKVNLVAMS